ncbi:MFS transporter [Acidithiobacillus sp. M4-SHS-6]|uniref:MFS transporter n=1 Tax=Acidithiobacillus sp. M4-SHS-6 TaxID=3383024 RepID=UPI0039BE6C4D
MSTLPPIIAKDLGQRGARRGSGHDHRPFLYVACPLFGSAERGRMQGMLSGVWGLAAIFGPLVGAALNATLGWCWVFWINLPIGLVALILLSRARDVGKGRTGVRIFPLAQAIQLLPKPGRRVRCQCPGCRPDPWWGRRGFIYCQFYRTGRNGDLSPASASGPNGWVTPPPPAKH